MYKVGDFNYDQHECSTSFTPQRSYTTRIDQRLKFRCRSFDYLIFTVVEIIFVAISTINDDVCYVYLYICFCFFFPLSLAHINSYV